MLAKSTKISKTGAPFVVPGQIISRCFLVLSQHAEVEDYLSPGPIRELRADGFVELAESLSSTQL